MAKLNAVKAKLPDLAGGDVSAILHSVGMTLISRWAAPWGRCSCSARPFARKSCGRQIRHSPPMWPKCSLRRGRRDPARQRPSRATRPCSAIHPAVEAAASQAAGAGTAGVLAAAAEAAQAGAVSTKELVAKVGRASRLGERTLGHQDPGATSVSIILRVAADALADANAPAANADTGR